MTEPEVVALMESSSNEQEWNDNADKIKATFGGRYPGFWWNAIMLSGIANRVQKSWISTTVEGLLDPLMKKENGLFTSIKLMPPDEQEIEQIKRKMREKQ